MAGRAKAADVVPIKQRVLPEFDGLPIDRFKMGFSGNFELDPSDPDDHDLIEKLKLGADVEVTIRCNVKGRPHDITLDKARKVKTTFGGAKLEAYEVVMDSVQQLRLAQRPEPNPLEGEGPADPFVE